MKRATLAPSVAAIAVAAVVFTSLAACGSSTTDLARFTTTTTPAGQPAASLPETPISGTIDVYDQTSDGATVTIDKVDLEGTAGWVIVHGDDHGPGPVLGHAAVPEGVSTNVVVHLDKPLTATADVWPMLHRDGGLPNVFQWPGGPDGPVRPPTGNLGYASRKITLHVDPAPAA